MKKRLLTLLAAGALAFGALTSTAFAQGGGASHGDGMKAEAAKAGGGFVAYRWAKPGEKGEVEKVAYAGLFKPWNWVVSSGVYMDDVQQQALVSIAEAWQGQPRRLSLNLPPLATLYLRVKP